MRNLYSFVRFIPLALVLAVSSRSVEASWILLEDFEDVTVGANLGAANPGENFTLNGTGLATVEWSAWDAANRAARLVNPQVQLFMPASIPQGTTATLFYQLYKPTGAVNISLGMSDDVAITDPTQFYWFESQLVVHSSTDPQAFRMRDGGTFRTSPTNFLPNTLYNVWHVINNTTDKTEMYVQRDGIDPAPIKLAEGSFDSFTFRNGVASNNLVNFLVMTGNSGAGVAAHSTAWFDNVYLSTGENLTNPVPEPTTWAMLAVALAIAGFKLRRR